MAGNISGPLRWVQLLIKAAPPGKANELVETLAKPMIKEQQGLETEAGQKLLTDLLNDAKSKGLVHAAVKYGVYVSPAVGAAWWARGYYDKNLGPDADPAAKASAKDELLRRVANAVQAAGEQGTDPNEDPTIGALERALKAGLADKDNRNVQVNDPRAEAVIDLFQAYRGDPISNGRPQIYDPSASREDRLLSTVIEELNKLKAAQAASAPAASAPALPSPIPAVEVAPPAPVAVAAAPADPAPAPAAPADPVVAAAPAPAPAAVVVSAPAPAAAPAVVAAPSAAAPAAPADPNSVTWG